MVNVLSLAFNVPKAARLGKIPAPVPEISWSPAPSSFPYLLARNQAHLWAFVLDLEPQVVEKLRAVLSPAEQIRAARYHFDRDRDRFIAGRAQLRRLLARYLHDKAERVTFDYGPHGKPKLAAPLNPKAISFNLAHSEGLGLAVICLSECGLDIERVRALPDQDALVARFFSSTENARFQKLPRAERPEAFFNLWTRKEAWLKAVGEGIGFGLNQVEVTFERGEPAQLLRLPSQAGECSRWSLSAFEPAAGFTAALALAVSNPDISAHQLEPEA